MTDIDIASLTKQTESVSSEFEKDFAATSNDLSHKAIEDVRIKYLGRKGLFTAISEQMRSVKKEDRPEAGKLLNSVKKNMESKLDQLRTLEKKAALTAQLDAKAYDVSLPVAQTAGSLHPVTLMRRTLLKEFRNLGFIVYDGPEMDLEDYNFSALNFKDDHPARDMQDTFFVKDLEKTVLRTHTSNIQIHAMRNERPPMRVVAPGRTYRCDSDLTHTPMFHQIEGLLIDRKVTMADLKSVLRMFASSYLGTDVHVRFRPSFFPFTEPSVEVDMSWQDSWLEMGGAGMVDPAVLKAVGYDPDEVSGFAFGLGIERLCARRHGIDDIREIYKNDVRFLHQF